MAKYHVNPETGEPGKCRAEKDGCPFGDEGAHYSTADDARKAYEAVQAALVLPPSVKAKLLSPPDTDHSFLSRVRLPGERTVESPYLEERELELFTKAVYEKLGGPEERRARELPYHEGLELEQEYHKTAARWYNMQAVNEAQGLSQEDYELMLRFKHRVDGAAEKLGYPTTAELLRGRAAVELEDLDGENKGYEERINNAYPEARGTTYNAAARQKALNGLRLRLELAEQLHREAFPADEVGYLTRHLETLGVEQKELDAEAHQLGERPLRGRKDWEQKKENLDQRRAQIRQETQVAQDEILRVGRATVS